MYIRFGLAQGFGRIQILLKKAESQTETWIWCIPNIDTLFLAHHKPHTFWRSLGCQACGLLMGFALRVCILKSQVPPACWILSSGTAQSQRSELQSNRIKHRIVSLLYSRVYSSFIIIMGHIGAKTGCVDTTCQCRKVCCTVERVVFFFVLVSCFTEPKITICKSHTSFIFIMEKIQT
ncbi:hypothetical protein XELAEV_18026166mg [Xenopus laevis]|uniref:Uncharacterized protein n=1 Tax=Xenopus laevis TaxID=8355 RepID=A0A974HIL6_XENLA|nr:hypothetical protein XELAEV_18026166mg [Xenopus laevis]